jgi:hypothetical protein
VTGVAWHEVPTDDTTTAVIRRWAPTYPGTTVRRHAPEPLWRRWHTPPAWADRIITAGFGVLTLLGGTLAAGAMA